MLHNARTSASTGRNAALGSHGQGRLRAETLAPTTREQAPTDRPTPAPVAPGHSPLVRTKSLSLRGSLSPTPNQNRPIPRPNFPRTPRDRHPDQRSTGNPSAPASRLSFIVVRAAGLREGSNRPNCRPNCGCVGCCPQECCAGLLTGQQGGDPPRTSMTAKSIPG
jgi:hypothetical protein